MITIFKRGRVWWAEANLDGDRRRWSLKTRDRQVADQLRRKAELEQLGGGALTPKTWQEFQLEFIAWISPHVRPKTMKGYRFTIDKLTAFLDSAGVTNLSDVHPSTVTRFMESRRRELHPSRKRAMTEGGVKFELRVLHRIFGYAIEAGYIAKNPVVAKNLNATAGATLPFSQDEIRRMFADKEVKAKPYLRALLNVFLHTGLRIGDVIDLRKAAIVRDKLLLKTRKRGTVVSLHIHDELADALRALYAAQTQAQRGAATVFSTESGLPLKNADKALRRVWRRAGIAKAHAHRFRDTFAVRLLAKGASLYDVSKLLGISIQTAELHYSPYVKELQERAANLLRTLDFHKQKRAS